MQALGPQRTRYPHLKKLHLLYSLHSEGLSDVSIYSYSTFAAKQSEHQPLGVYYGGRGVGFIGGICYPSEWFTVGTFSALCAKKF